MRWEGRQRGQWRQRGRGHSRPPLARAAGTIGSPFLRLVGSFLHQVCGLLRTLGSFLRLVGGLLRPVGSLPRLVGSPLHLVGSILRSFLLLLVSHMNGRAITVHGPPGHARAFRDLGDPAAGRAIRGEISGAVLGPPWQASRPAPGDPGDGSCPDGRGRGRSRGRGTHRGAGMEPALWSVPRQLSGGERYANQPSEAAELALAMLSRTVSDSSQTYGKHRCGSRPDGHPGTGRAAWAGACRGVGGAATPG
jgi:hypothetical protein